MIKVLRELVEALRKPGVMSAIGRKRERACARDLEKYFGLLLAAVERAKFGELAGSENVDAALSAADMKLQRITRALRPALAELMILNLYQAFLEGEAQLNVTGLLEADRFGDKGPGGEDAPPPSTLAGEVQKAAIRGALQPVLKEIDRLGLTGKAAADYAAKHTASLVVGLDATTRKLLREAIEEGIRDRLGVDGLARLIRNAVLDMSTYRARMIASTEMNDAISEATLQKLRAQEVEYKRLVLAPGACKICIENAAEGPIPLEQAFQSGQLRTPFHPWCRCATVGSRPPATQ